MATTFQHFFFPHAGNNYRPAILHGKRMVFYSLFFITLKAIVVLFAILLPAQAFMLPDVLAGQYKKVITLTNALRQEKGLSQLTESRQLDLSAGAKAADMASKQYFSHIDQSGHSLAYFLDKVDYRYQIAGENLAMGFNDAESVVSAWIKSQTHYANLIDKDFKDIGVSLESGLYNNEPTVYVVQHFGDAADVKMASAGLTPRANRVARVQRRVSSSALPPEKAPAPVAASKREAAVRGEKISAPTKIQPIILDKNKSRVYWLAAGEQTILQVRAIIQGPVRSATVVVNNYPIELKADAINGQFSGRLTVPEKVDNFFKTIVPPVITITDSSGAISADAVDWFNIKVPEATVVQRYLQAKKMLGPITNLFGVSQAVYLAFILFFTVALAINILVEIKRQHYRLIGQTLALVILLAWLVWI